MAGTNSTCPLYRGVHFNEVSVKREWTVMHLQYYQVFIKKFGHTFDNFEFLCFGLIHPCSERVLVTILRSAVFTVQYAMIHLRPGKVNETGQIKKLNLFKKIEEKK